MNNNSSNTAPKIIRKRDANIFEKNRRKKEQCSDRKGSNEVSRRLNLPPTGLGNNCASRVSIQARTQTDYRLLIYSTRPIIVARVGVTSIAAMLIDLTDTKVLWLTCAHDEFCLFIILLLFFFLKE